MKYVYILQTVDGAHFYFGITDDVEERLKAHNAKQVSHTSKYGPWELRTYVAFSNADRAFAFERYLKSASGRAFSSKRL